MSTKYDLPISKILKAYVDSDFQFRFKRKINGAYTDFTNWYIKINIKNKAGQLIASFNSTDDPDTVMHTTDGVDIVLEEVSVNAIPPGNYYYNITLTGPDGVSTRYFDGVFIVIDS